ncbi:NRDE protein-domain-containing protein [Dipodascopsis tothii]|uniref:NRDE protein-domain-containing protein n=1 Tax=Dipodascopsis tothii TaxID=44089 RepID=UPI0034CE23AD
MCILLLTTAHPKYALILLSNRDEYLNRKTSTAEFWHPKILSPLDLARPAPHGTWLGITRHGRLAVVLNYREDGENYVGKLSRGLLVREFLSDQKTTHDWAAQAITRMEELSGDVGGFSLVCGELKPNGSGLEEFAIITNRSRSLGEGTAWIFGDDNDNEYTGDEDIRQSIMEKTYGISNSLYWQPWPKVHRGREMLSTIILNSLKQNSSAHLNEEEQQQALIESLLDLLSVNSISESVLASGDPDLLFKSLGESIFIPAFHTGRATATGTPADYSQPREDSGYKYMKGGYYGTRTQTVVLVSTSGEVTYVEKTLHNCDDNTAGNQEGTVVHRFQIEGWDAHP